MFTANKTKFSLSPPLQLLLFLSFHFWPNSSSHHVHFWPNFSSHHFWPNTSCHRHLSHFLPNTSTASEISERTFRVLVLPTCALQVLVSAKLHYTITSLLVNQSTGSTAVLWHLCRIYYAHSKKSQGSLFLDALILNLLPSLLSQLIHRQRIYHRSIGLHHINISIDGHEQKREKQAWLVHTSYYMLLILYGKKIIFNHFDQF